MANADASNDKYFVFVGEKISIEPVIPIQGELKVDQQFSPVGWARFLCPRSIKAITYKRWAEKHCPPYMAGSYSGMSFGIAAGYSAGSQQTLTGVYSMNNGWIGFNSNSNTSSGASGLASQISSKSSSSAADGGFVLYPNMSNTNQL